MTTQSLTLSAARRLPVWRLLAITAFAFALTMISNTLNPVVYNHQIRQFIPADSVNTALGLTTFASLLVAAVTQPLVGILSDRTRSALGRRVPYFIAGTLLTIGCMLGIGGAPDFAWFVLMVLLNQVALNVVQGPWQALIPDQVPEAQRGQAAGIRAMLDIIAVVVGGGVAAQLIARYEVWGSTALLLAVGIPCLVLVGALAVTALGAREKPLPAMQEQPPQPIALGEVLTRAFQVDFAKYPAFRWWLLNRALFWAGQVALTLFLLNFARDVQGMSDADANQLYSRVILVVGIAVLVAALPSGYLSDRFGRKPLMIAAGLLAAGGAALFVLAPGVNTLVLGGAVVGLGTGMFMSSNWALATDIIPREEAARYLGIANIATALGSAGARLLGVVIDGINRAAGSASLGYFVVYGLVVAMFALSAVVIWRMRLPARGGEPQGGETLPAP